MLNEFFNGSSGGDDYLIERSLRFTPTDSSYLTRNFASGGDSTKYTWSAWVKRSGLGTFQTLFSSATGNTSQPRTSWDFNNNDRLVIGFNITASSWVEVQTSRMFVDVSAWYHIVVSVDLSQPVNTDRVKVYVNGERETNFAAYPTVDQSGSHINTAVQHSIGRYEAGNSNYLDGYLADLQMVNGRALSADTFGFLDDDGVWQPKAAEVGAEYTTSQITSTTDITRFNRTTTWSSSPNGNMEGFSNLFEGSTGPYTSIANGEKGTFSWNASDLGTFSTFEMYVSKANERGSTFKINDVDYHDSIVLNSWNSFPITSFYAFESQSPGSEKKYRIHAIRVDGYILNDTTPNGGVLGQELTFADSQNLDQFTVGTEVPGAGTVTEQDVAGNSLTLDTASMSTGQTLTIGGYGSTGFHLDFADNSSTANLGLDVSGNGNNWTPNNLSHSSADAIAAEFNGTAGNYLRRNNNAIMPPSSGSFTIECHFYPFTTSVVGLFDGGPGEVEIIRQYDVNAVEKQGGGSVSFAGTYFQNTWNHFAAVYDGVSDVMTVYINGTSVGATTFSSYARGSKFDIGGINTGGDGAFDGRIRNFRVSHSVVYSGNFTAPSYIDNLDVLGTTRLLVITTAARGLTADAYGVNPLTQYGTVVNFVVSSPAECDSLIDSPTNYEPESGGNPGGNYCTFNSLPPTNLDFNNGNLDLTNNGSGWGVGVGTMSAESGKWYYEVTVTGTGLGIGIEPTSHTPGPTDRIGSDTPGYGWWTDRNNYYGNNQSIQGLGSVGTVNVGDVLGVVLDLDAGTLIFSKNGSLGTGFTFTGITGRYTPAVGSVLNSGTVSASVNFGQRPFKYAPGQTGGPSADHKAWCSANLDAPIADGSTAFDIATWTGDHDTGSGSNASRTIPLPGDMNPDLLWIKRSSSSYNHLLNDNVRGFAVNKGLSSNTSDPEDGTGSDYTYGFVSGTANGEFTVQSGIVDSYTNKLNETYVGWAWGGGDLATASDTTNYDQSQTWSSNTTGSFAGDLEALAFNGVLSTSSTTGRVRPDNGTTAGFTFSNLGTVTSLRIWVHQGGTGGTVFTINGTDVTATVDAATNSSFVDFGSTFNSLTSITFNAVDGSNWYSVAGIEVNGKLLIDPGVIPTGSLNNSVYNQSQVWSTYGSASSGGAASGLGLERGFNGDISNQTEGDTTGAYFSIPFSATITVGDVGFVSYASAGDGHMRLYNGANEVDDITSSGNSSFKYSTYAGPITEIRISRDGRPFEFAAVSVFGKVLVDSNQSPPDVPSIDSTVRANQAAGFSIVSYSSSNAGVQSPGHGLNAVPELVLTKQRDGASNWTVYLKGGTSFDELLNLNTPNSKSSVGSAWGSGSNWTAATFGVNTTNNQAGDQIAYCWTPVEGYSAAFTYTGSGGFANDHPYINLGFRPRLIIMKSTSGGREWAMYDTSRDPYNKAARILFPSSDAGIPSNLNGYEFHIMSNGFSMISDSQKGEFNAYNETYVGFAWAEHPFKTARAR